jgi:hypothetical protein
MKCEPSLITTCLPWRTILNPAFECAHRAEMIDAGNFRHLLDRHFHFAYVGVTHAFFHGGKIILNRVANVLHRFLLGFALRPAAGKGRAIHRVTFFRLMKHDLIS